MKSSTRYNWGRGAIVGENLAIVPLPGPSLQSPQVSFTGQSDSSLYSRFAGVLRTRQPSQPSVMVLRVLRPHFHSTVNSPGQEQNRGHLQSLDRSLPLLYTNFAQYNLGIFYTKSNIFFQINPSFSRCRPSKSCRPLPLPSPKSSFSTSKLSCTSPRSSSMPPPLRLRPLRPLSLSSSRSRLNCSSRSSW